MAGTTTTTTPKTQLNGKDIFYLFRIMGVSGKTGARLAFTKENSREISVDSETVTTKDGSVTNPGTPEITISATTGVAEGDELPYEIEKAMLDGKKFEIWEINKSRKGTGDKYKAKYYQGSCTSWGLTSSAEDKAELSLEFAVDGKGVEGDITLTADQEAELEYSFADPSTETV